MTPEELDRIAKWAANPNADCIEIVDHAVPDLIAEVRVLDESLTAAALRAARGELDLGLARAEISRLLPYEHESYQQAAEITELKRMLVDRLDAAKEADAATRVMAHRRREAERERDHYRDVLMHYPFSATRNWTPWEVRARAVLQSNADLDSSVPNASQSPEVLDSAATVLHCLKCHREQPLPYTDASHQHIDIRSSNGWSLDGTAQLCPACSTPSEDFSGE